MARHASDSAALQGRIEAMMQESEPKTSEVVWADWLAMQMRKMDEDTLSEYYKDTFKLTMKHVDLCRLQQTTGEGAFKARQAGVPQGRVSSAATTATATATATTAAASAAATTAVIGPAAK
jgi:hypothetical protein